MNRTVEISPHRAGEGVWKLILQFSEDGSKAVAYSRLWQTFFTYILHMLLLWFVTSGRIARSINVNQPPKVWALATATGVKRFSFQTFRTWWGQNVTPTFNQGCEVDSFPATPTPTPTSAPKNWLRPRFRLCRVGIRARALARLLFSCTIAANVGAQDRRPPDQQHPGVSSKMLR